MSHQEYVLTWWFFANWWGEEILRVEFCGVEFIEFAKIPVEVFLVVSNYFTEFFNRTGVTTGDSDDDRCSQENEDGWGWIRMDLNPYQTTLGEPDQGSFTNKSIRCHHDVILEFLFKDLRKLNQNALGCVEKNTKHTIPVFQMASSGNNINVHNWWWSPLASQI